MFNGFKSPPGLRQPSTPDSDVDFANAVKRSDSGQLSVSIEDVSKTPSFKRDLETLARIRQRAESGSSGR